MTPRLYCPLPLGTGADIDLPAAAAHHAVRVLRLGVGSDVILFNGKGGEFAATIDVAGPRAVIARVRDRVDVDRESPLDVTVVHGLASTDRMDYAVQKMVELGVSRMVPVTTSRSVVQLDERRALKRVEHWRSIAIASCEQCGRNVVPDVAALGSLKDWLRAAAPKSTSVPIRLLLSPDAERSLASMAPPSGAIELLVGPEGGFTDDEAQAARDAGFTPLRVGPRILRTETAAAATLAAMNALWGDWR